MIGYEDVKEKNKEGLSKEKVKIWRLDTLSFIHEEILDLEDNPLLKEDPSKLIILSDNGSYLFLRTENKKGIKTLYLEDGSKVDESMQIHRGPIL